MAVDYNFIQAVLREYSVEERTAISQIAEKECQLDGVVNTMDIWNMANTYMAIYILAVSDSTREKVGGLSRSRMNSQKLANQYRQSYLSLLNDAGLTPRVLPTDKNAPSLPEVLA